MKTLWKNPKSRLIVHGGAWSFPDDLNEANLRGVSLAIETVFPLLESGEITALDAVEKCVNILEEDPTYDAGKGSVLTSEGEIELDASIMNGKTLDTGAVASVKNVLHPISVARRVMEKTEHCLLVGEGAQKFIKKEKFPFVTTEELLSDRELENFKNLKDKEDYHMIAPFEFPKGTVGCVAMDIYGNIAAGTSTGGIPRKIPGRVGDTPIVGAGTYADNELGGCSCTGFGESIMKVLLAKYICDSMKTLDSSDAAKGGIDYLERKVNGKAGVITIDSKGNYGIHKNTMKMAVAYVDPESGEVVSSL